MKQSIYWGSVEYAYNSKHSQYRKLRGGFVYVFLFTTDVLEYLKAVESDFENLHMNIVQIEFASKYDVEMVWDTQESTTRYKQIAKKAKQTKQVVFDNFWAYQ